MQNLHYDGYEIESTPRLCVFKRFFFFFFLSFSERSIYIGLETATMPALIGDLHELERRFWSIEIVFFFTSRVTLSNQKLKKMGNLY